MKDHKLYILRILGAYRDSQILNTALEYDIFTHISNGTHSAAKLAKRTSTNKNALTILLDALLALNLLKKEKGAYYLSPLSETFLVKGKPQFLGDFRYTALWAYEGMANLKDIIKTGKPIEELSLETPNHPNWERLSLGLAHFTKPAAEYLCKVLSNNNIPKGIKVLDLGGGSGIFATALLKYDPTIEFYQLDSAQVNKVAREFLASEGIESYKVTFIDGDIKNTELPKESFDLVILSNICHHEDTSGNMNLFKRAYKILVSGGRVAVNDFLVNNEHTGPPLSLLFRVMMLAMNPKGGVYSFEEYKSWLTKAGFKEITVYNPIPETYGDTAIIMGEKGY